MEVFVVVVARSNDRSAPDLGGEVFAPPAVDEAELPVGERVTQAAHRLGRGVERDAQREPAAAAAAAVVLERDPDLVHPCVRR